MEVTSYIYDFLMAKGDNDTIRKYNLEPFQVKVLSIERTFIDKVFALGDYYLTKNVEGHSRHIYDLHMLFPEVSFNDKFKKLVSEVREIGMPHSSCYSVQDGVNLKELLQKIVSEDFYKSDYNEMTQTILFEAIAYEESIDTVKKIISKFPF